MPVTSKIRVRYAETDQMCIVYYANFLVWFEIGRVELLRTSGYSYAEMETVHHCMIPVIDVNCRYRAPARYDDEILIETGIGLLRESVVKFIYRVMRKDPNGGEPKLLADGESVHVICDKQMNRKPLPESIREKLRVHLVEKLGETAN
jgi:acyl-CoA thioester hydrolase